MAVEGIDQGLVDAANGLFDTLAPEDAVYADETPVTVELTRGDVYEIRASLRWSASGFLQNVEMAELYGTTPTPEQAADTSNALRQIVGIENKLVEATADLASV